MWLREHEGREWTGRVPKEPAPQREAARGGGAEDWGSRSPNNLLVELAWRGQDNVRGQKAERRRARTRERSPAGNLRTEAWRPWSGSGVQPG